MTSKWCDEIKKNYVLRNENQNLCSMNCLGWYCKDSNPLPIIKKANTLTSKSCEQYMSLRKGKEQILY